MGSKQTKLLEFIWLGLGRIWISPKANLETCYHFRPNPHFFLAWKKSTKLQWVPSCH